MKIIIQDEWYTVESVKSNPYNIYVFGDNSLRVGNGGQAQIRMCSNTFGVVTKMRPSMTEESFFNDGIECLAYLLSDLIELKRLMLNDKTNTLTLVFPKDGLGTGLSKLKEKSPFINKILIDMLEQYFNICTLSDDSLEQKRINL